VDASVGVAANLVYVTTGPAACLQLSEVQVQIAMTPIVATRVAQILRASLEYPDLVTRQSFVEAWASSERAQFPHGCVEIDAYSVRIGIEPIGCGARVAVLWQHIPALIVHLETCAQYLMGEAA
jgi:hypothetical protein